MARYTYTPGGRLATIESGNRIITRYTYDGEGLLYGLSVQKISEIYQENLLAEKMFYVATDEADTNVTDEEASEAIRKEEAKTASGSALQTEEDISITQDMIDQQKEKIIRQRKS